MLRTAKQLAIALYEYGHLLGRPGHWPVLLQPSRQHPICDARAHLIAALEWLCRAHDAGGGQGVSAGYFLRRGWMPPYPETTGYIIPTLLACRSHNPHFVERAQRMGDWEIAVQLPSGAVRGGIGLNDYPIVFNTGQVMLGWTALYRHAGDERYLDAARRAADWLLDIQDGDGKWTRHTYLDAPRAYHARVAWPLLEVFALSGDERYRRAARSFIDWLLPLQEDSGFFPHMALQPSEYPITHTIAYTLRGLLECARLLGDEGTTVRAAVQRAVDGLLRSQSQMATTGFVPAALDASWNGRAGHMCLTGNAQLAIVLFALSDSPDSTPHRIAHTLVNRLKTHQSLRSRHPGIRGGLPSSFPMYGAYVPYAILNWSTKFFADALLAAGTATTTD